MKVYFVASPRAKKDYGKAIAAAYDAVSKLGYQHTSKFIVDVNADELYQRSQEEIEEHYKETMKAVKEADFVVVDVSVASMSMGYIIDRAAEYSKPVIILHVRGKQPFFFSGIQDEKVQIVEYDEDTAYKVLQNAFDYAADQQDTRFNFFISPKIANYLDWISKKKRLPRAVFLRRLIEADMKADKEYNA